ncbi:DUF3592 domain-containing protein [Roseateles sp.]|uniref:DUF3592 domain-containing protein n=1 Tax=Roseateles sp. TaxID=1971397 RepID=UPI0032641B5C
MLTAFQIFGVALLLGSIPLSIKSARRVRTYRQMQAWPKARARITKSFVREESSGDGMANLAEFEFVYSVAGIEHTSNLQTEGLRFPGTEEDVQQMLKRFPVGASVQVAVDPADPGRAILDTGFPAAWNALKRASAIGFLVGLAICLATISFAK